jgi:hypothetical protein
MGVGVVCLAALCAGCIETVTLVKIKADGSGTLEQTVLMSKAAREQMRMMMQSMSEGLGGKAGGFDEQALAMLKTDELVATAAKLGKGVTFVSADTVETDKAEGYRAVYAFDDINQLRINQNPGENVPSSPGQESEAETELVTFAFRKGKTPSLTVRRPRSGRPDGRGSEGRDTATGGTVLDEGEELDVDKAIEQAKQMFEGMRVAMVIEVDGAIVETNATHVSGNRVTLMDLDFEKLLGAPEHLEKFAKANPATVEGAKRLVEGVPGMKVDLHPEVVVRFK